MSHNFSAAPRKQRTDGDSMCRDGKHRWPQTLFSRDEPASLALTDVNSYLCIELMLSSLIPNTASFSQHFSYLNQMEWWLQGRIIPSKDIAFLPQGNTLAKPCHAPDRKPKTLMRQTQVLLFIPLALRMIPQICLSLQSPCVATKSPSYSSVWLTWHRREGLALGCTHLIVLLTLLGTVYVLL